MILSDFQQVLAVALYLLKNYLQSVNNFPALHEKSNPDRETDLKYDFLCEANSTSPFSC